MDICLYCAESLGGYSRKFCSNQCQGDYRYRQYIQSWRDNSVSGNRGIATRNISKHIVRYLFIKYESKCARCYWNAINIHMNKVPLEIDHIDGNSENNLENNLILLCPNCHSLTNTYKGLNKGNGRLWRREKYVKIV